MSFGEKKKKKKSADGICQKFNVLIITDVVFLEEFWGLRFSGQKKENEWGEGKGMGKKNEVGISEIPLACTITTV